MVVAHAGPPRALTALLEAPAAAAVPLAPIAVVLLLLASAVCVFAAPLAMPSPYSWWTHAISESAAQGQRSAWIARLGFYLFGGAVLWLALGLRAAWPRATGWMQITFALCMFGTAAFSHKPWLPGVPFDATEDLLHSITASGMGFAFALGALARLLQRGKGETARRIVDATALLAAGALSPLGELWPSIGGLLQRLMFAVAYLWFAHEALNPRSAKRP